jgi:phosphoribosylamine-glycine ligase
MAVKWFEGGGMHSYQINAFSPDWFFHQVMSAIIHSTVYAMISHLFRGLPLGAAIIMGIGLLAICWITLRIVKIVWTHF